MCDYEVCSVTFVEKLQMGKLVMTVLKQLVICSSTVQYPYRYMNLFVAWDVYAVLCIPGRDGLIP